MKKNQERRLHRKNAKIVKEGGTPMQLNRPVKPDTTRRCGHCGQMGHMSTLNFVLQLLILTTLQKPIANVLDGQNSTAAHQSLQPLLLLPPPARHPPRPTYPIWVSTAAHLHRRSAFPLYHLLLPPVHRCLDRTRILVHREVPVLRNSS